MDVGWIPGHDPVKIHKIYAYYDGMVEMVI